MATESLLVRTESMGFQPIDPDTFARVKNGEVISVKWSKARNPMFHRKLFALFNVIFDILPESEKVAVDYKGLKVIPLRDFNETRRWLTVQAGFYDVFGLPDGSVKIEAKSIKFSRMDNDEFEHLFDAIIRVGLKAIPIEMTETEMRHAVDEILRFG